MLIDVLILNRNLKNPTDQLCRTLTKLPLVSFVGVIDSGSRKSEISEYTFCKDQSREVKRRGLRFNRGFSLGLQKWAESESKSDYILLLPNDSKLFKWDIAQFENDIQGVEYLAAVIPLDPKNGYNSLLVDTNTALGWNFHEGPILISAKFYRYCQMNSIDLFDVENFRGYLSFIELAVKIYANNWCFAATKSISFVEDTSLLLNSHNLIKTEPVSENMRLLLDEGHKWLVKKYGLPDRWNLELVARLLFDEYIRVNQDSPLKPLL